MIRAHLLSLIVFTPLACAPALLFFRRRESDWPRRIALAATGIDLLLVLSLFFGELRAQAVGDLLLSEHHPWIEPLGIRFDLGLDGLSLCLILLTAFIGVLAVLVSWKQVKTRVAAFHFFLLFMQTGVMGVFLATDLMVFYLFWEMQVVPMFFLIGIWGHENRAYATVKFVLFSMAGSLLMLVALIVLYLIHGSQTGIYDFSLAGLMRTQLDHSTQMWLYSAFLLAFAVKIPVFPLHTWLPDAHTEAPTAGSVILAGLLLKTGVYALVRFAWPLFPTAAASTSGVVVALGLTGVFYASWIALAQDDMKRLVAYSSIGHMGLIVFGIAAWNAMSLSGAVLQMINHGLTTSALFILVGMLDERLHTREIAAYGGIWKRMPVFGAFFLLFAMASLGLPGLNNFVGEILILLGAFRERPVAAMLGFAGIVLVLVYVLRLVQDVLYGEPRGASPHAPLADLTAREAAILVPLAAAVLWIGLYPAPILDLIQGPVHGLTGGAAIAMSGLLP